MNTSLQSSLAESLNAAAREAGLQIVSVETGADFHRKPTSRFRLALSQAAGERSLVLELSDSLDLQKPGLNGEDLLPALASHLRDAAKRLRNPRPDAHVTMAGLPVSFADFAWPFHRSTSGADTYIVHGIVRLEDGGSPQLHARISASMTVTFAEIVPAPEQPYAETFIYNAVRKTLDLGQLELLKSGNRQPVPVTTRYYSRWQKRFIFNDTTEKSRREFLETKVYWLAGVLGGNQPVWIADPGDAQYLNSTEAELEAAAAEVRDAGMIELADGYATATSKLLERAPEFKAKLDAALATTKPVFNEEMRHGHTNM